MCGINLANQSKAEKIIQKGDFPIEICVFVQVTKIWLWGEWEEKRENQRKSIEFTSFWIVLIERCSHFKWYSTGLKPQSTPLSIHLDFQFSFSPKSWKFNFLNFHNVFFSVVFLYWSRQFFPFLISRFKAQKKYF